MKHERVVEFIGGTDEEVAWLRLSLRRAAVRLVDKWRLRRDGDGQVDLMLIADNGETGTPLPDVPRRVRLLDPAFGSAGIETILWPPPLDQLVSLFNLVGITPDVPAPVSAPAAPPAPVIQHNVYDDIFETEVSPRWSADDTLLIADDSWAPVAPSHEAELMRQADDFFKRDIRQEQRESLRAMRLSTEVDVEATEGRTDGGQSRMGRRDVTAQALSTGLQSLSLDDAVAVHPLEQYLSGRLLPGPSRIEAHGVQITFNPRNRQFYSRAGLCVFEDCVRHGLRRGDFVTLLAADFEAIKRDLPARPYAELQWLCAYLSPEAAAADLDEQLRYRVLGSLDLRRDYPRAARVAAELERGSTLRAAASAARVPLAESQRVAYAFDVAGMLVPE